MTAQGNTPRSAVAAAALSERDATATSKSH